MPREGKTLNQYVARYGEAGEHLYRRSFKKKTLPWTSSFHHIIERCWKPTHPSFSRYGGRGIRCRLTNEDLRVAYFRDRAWLIDEPCVDRLDSDRDYTADNVRWISKSENSKKAAHRMWEKWSASGRLKRSWKKRSLTRKINPMSAERLLGAQKRLAAMTGLINKRESWIQFHQEVIMKIKNKVARLEGYIAARAAIAAAKGGK